MNHRSIQGLSLMEAVVTLTIIGTLAMLIAPTVATTKRSTKVVECAAQMNQIAVAIKQYQHEHKGELPGRLADLAPRYLGKAELLVCPFVLHAVPDAVEQASEAMKKRNLPWASYFYFSQKALDEIAAREGDVGYSQVLARRKGSTPLVICRDHREPFSLNPFLGASRPRPGIDASQYPKWFHPEEPIIVLRYDGRVQKSRKGGTRTHLTSIGTIHELETL